MTPVGGNWLFYAVVFYCEYNWEISLECSNANMLSKLQLALKTADAVTFTVAFGAVLCVFRQHIQSAVAWQHHGYINLNRITVELLLLQRHSVETA